MTTGHSERLSDAGQISLVERLKAREADAEAELVRLFTGPLRLMMSARTRDEEAARDLAQEALLHALVAIRDDRLREPDRLAAFIFGIGRNVVNNHLRRRRDAPREVPLDLDMAGLSTQEDREEEQRRELAVRALAVLGTVERQILSLTLGDGLKPGAIATRLGITAEVVRTRKSRALKRVIAEVARLTRSTGADH